MACLPKVHAKKVWSLVQQCGGSGTCKGLDLASGNQSWRHWPWKGLMLISLGGLVLDRDDCCKARLPVLHLPFPFLFLCHIVTQSRAPSPETEPPYLELSLSNTELNNPLFFVSIQLQLFCYSNTKWINAIVDKK